ncbi:LysM peptidoglycan-binding domain-containing protein [Cellulosilyticum ruminicola]|uniref:LysM peptidoglycan-binding domain-containing protein n=1 Tax=Cellulosilyticum ruminicola TaxID=425254 RepID=UPI0006D284E4|nr:LysM peptidoglycan-binding domain-containing protein [Cellulosilyticum ruminicola]
MLGRGRRGEKVIKISDRRRKGHSVRVDNHMIRIAVVIGIGIGILLTFMPNAYQISIDGTVVGAIKDKKVIEHAKETVKAQLKSEYGSNIQFEDELVLKRYKANKKDYIQPEYLVTYMRKSMGILIEFKEILVDGKSVGIVATDEDVESLKEALKERYYAGRDVDVEFGKDVKIVNKFAKESELTSINRLVEICSATTPKSVIYTVKGGDTLYGIALSLGITVDNLKSANPELNDRTVLSIGDKLKANIYEPLLPLRIVEPKGQVNPEQSDNAAVQTTKQEETTVNSPEN